MEIKRRRKRGWRREFSGLFIFGEGLHGGMKFRCNSLRFAVALFTFFYFCHGICAIFHAFFSLHFGASGIASQWARWKRFNVAGSQPMAGFVRCFLPRWLFSHMSHVECFTRWHGQSTSSVQVQCRFRTCLREPAISQAISSAVLINQSRSGASSAARQALHSDDVPGGCVRIRPLSVRTVRLHEFSLQRELSGTRSQFQPVAGLGTVSKLVHRPPSSIVPPWLVLLGVVSSQERWCGCLSGAAHVGPLFSLHRASCLAQSAPKVAAFGLAVLAQCALGAAQSLVR